jgi:hypothetical protein
LDHTSLIKTILQRFAADPEQAIAKMGTRVVGFAKMKPREMLSLIVCAAAASVIATYITRAVDAAAPQVARLSVRMMRVFWIEACILIVVPLAFAFGIYAGLSDAFRAPSQVPVAMSLLLAEIQFIAFFIVWLGSFSLILAGFEIIESRE